MKWDLTDIKACLWCADKMKTKLFLGRLPLLPETNIG